MNLLQVLGLRVRVDIAVVQLFNRVFVRREEIVFLATVDRHVHRVGAHGLAT